MYGLNGLHISVNIKLFNSYQLPRLLYGLEVLPLNKGDKEAIDQYHRITLKYLQHLPPGTATVSLYLILGILPPSVILERNTLTLFANLIRDKSTLEWQIIRRQLAVKSKDSNTWINTIKDILLQYNLPSAYELFNNPPSKHQWKKAIRVKVLEETFRRMKIEASRKVSLNYLNLDQCHLGKLHPVWQTVMNSHKTSSEDVPSCVFLLDSTGSRQWRNNREDQLLASYAA